MSDLISRSELYDQLANKLTWLMKYGDDVYLAVGSDIRDVIYNMPTAYSVDKVVEELNELDVKSITRYKNGNFGDFDGVEYYIKKREAIEIVKQGSVSDDECEWKKSKDYPFDWLVGCDGCEVNHRQGDYCPRCGKKIKVVE